jgi:hypothetical protein
MSGPHIETLYTQGKLFTSTNVYNERMQRLCERLGYVRSGIIENLDEDDPELFYFKRLSNEPPFREANYHYVSFAGKPQKSDLYAHERRACVLLFAISSLRRLTHPDTSPVHSVSISGAWKQADLQWRWKERVEAWDIVVRQANQFCAIIERSLGYPDERSMAPTKLRQRMLKITPKLPALKNREQFARQMLGIRRQSAYKGA